MQSASYRTPPLLETSNCLLCASYFFSGSLKKKGFPRSSCQSFSYTWFAISKSNGLKKKKHMRVRACACEQIVHPEARAVRRPQYKLEELEELSGPEDGTDSSYGSGAGGGIGSGRRYLRSLLHRLPHAWSTPEDTRLEVAMLRRRGSGGSGGSGGSCGRGDEDGAREVGGDGSPAPGKGVVCVEAAGGDEGGLVRVVVARTRDGLEAVDLSTGRPLSAVALPAAASGAGVYADVNGDGVVDHVQVRNGSQRSCV